MQNLLDCESFPLIGVMDDAMTDEAFARDVLKDGIGAAHVTVGFDFRFGRGHSRPVPTLVSA